MQVRMRIAFAHPGRGSLTSPWVETTKSRADAVENLVREQLKNSPPSGVLSIDWANDKTTYVPIAQVAHVTFERKEA